MEGLFWLINIVILGVVVGWAVAVLRRLGDQTKLLRRIAEDVSVIRDRGPGHATPPERG